MPRKTANRNEKSEHDPSKLTILLLTDSGCEDACAEETRRWVKATPKTEPNIVSISGSLDDAITLGYHLQTARRVLVEITPPLTTAEELESRKPDEQVMAMVFPDTLTFKADAEVLSLPLEPMPATDLIAFEDDAEGSEDDDTEEIDAATDGINGELDTGEEDEETFVASKLIPQTLIEEIGGWMHGLGRKVNLSRPDVIVYGIATPSHIRVGVDIIGHTLSKREYRIILSRRSLKATVAAATVIYAGAKENEVLLDPLADDGTIAVESALYLTGTSPLKYAKGFSFERFPAFAGKDWNAWRKAQDTHEKIGKVTAYGATLQEMKAVRTNAKLAGIEKDIHATKVTMEWVETKFDEKSVDRIITAPMQSGKSVAPQVAQKHADMLFYQAEFILKKGKTITCISEKPDELLPHAEKYGFSVAARRHVLMGKRRMTVITFKNNKRKADKEE